MNSFSLLLNQPLWAPVDPIHCPTITFYMSPFCGTWIIDVHCISQDVVNYTALTDVPWCLSACHDGGLLLTWLKLAIVHLWPCRLDSELLAPEEGRDGGRALAFHGPIWFFEIPIFIQSPYFLRFCRDFLLLIKPESAWPGLDVYWFILSFSIRVAPPASSCIFRSTHRQASDCVLSGLKYQTLQDKGHG